MDWENKFTSLLREANSNLSKTRRKINSSRMYHNDRQFSSSMPMRRSSSLLEFPHTDLHTSIYSQHGATEHVGNSSGLVQALSDRLEEQNRLIDQLRQMVTKLETDRSNYSEQIRELKNEVYKLSGHEGPSIERKINQVRHDLSEDIQILNSQLQSLRSTGSNRISDNHFYALSKDVHEVKHSLREDMDIIKRDIDTVKSKLYKMELDVASSFNNGKDLQRKQDILDQSVHEIASQQHRHQYRSLGSPTPNNDKLSMSELRSTVSLLKDRVYNMEAVMNSAQTTPRYSTPVMQNGFHTPSPAKQRISSSKKQKPVYMSIKLDNDIDSDLLLLSDDDSSDLEIFNPNKQYKTGLESDDDLDLDDLDLDDDMGSVDSDLNDL